MATHDKIITLTPPTVYPVTLSEVKDQLIVEHNDQDAEILGYIAAATSTVELLTGKSLVMQKKRLFLNRFKNAIYLPRGPVQFIEQIQYLDTDKATQTLSTSPYIFNTVENYIRLDPDYSWPSTYQTVNAVWIDYWCGFFDATVSPIQQTDNIPEPLKLAIKMLCADYYKNRESQTAKQGFYNHAFHSLINPYRDYLLG